MISKQLKYKSISAAYYKITPGSSNTRQSKRRPSLRSAPGAPLLGFSPPRAAMEEEDDIKEIFNPNTVLPHMAKGEAAMRTIKKGETIQVERRGFYICDEPYVRASEPMKLFFVPDGKSFFGVPLKK